mmetsp:Transcript_22876/g.38295  ORF Transcript_22876/g.38295 Transcript_22876/m.38295 type:complete len:119 (+) Transcript_22876:65-421(+)
MDIEEIIDSFPKPLLALLLLLFFVAKVVWSAAGSNVNTVTSMKEWDEFIEDAKKENKLVVVHFHSAWCKVSKITAPLFRQWCKGKRYTTSTTIKLVQIRQDKNNSCNLPINTAISFRI